MAREITLRQAADVCCGDLTLEQFQTLQAVSASDPLSIGALSARLRVALSTMSRNVSVLERNGYLLRARSAEDGRIVHVGITPRASGRSRPFAATSATSSRDVYQRLPAGERPRSSRRWRSCGPAWTNRTAPPPPAVAPVPVRRSDERRERRRRLRPRSLAPARRRRRRRHRLPAGDRHRLGDHGRAARGRKRRARAAGEHHRDRRRPGGADPDLRRRVGRALQSRRSRSPTPARAASPGGTSAPTSPPSCWARSRASRSRT